MKERPINLTPDEVRRLHDGRVTELRRPIKPQPLAGVRLSSFVASGFEAGHGREIRCPYGDCGDLLWGREPMVAAFLEPYGTGCLYAVDGAVVCPPWRPWTWKKQALSAAAMPRWASRWVLASTEVGVSWSASANRWEWVLAVELLDTREALLKRAHAAHEGSTP